MQPNPRAETSRPLFPNVRFRIVTTDAGDLGNHRKRETAKGADFLELTSGHSLREKEENAWRLRWIFRQAIPKAALEVTESPRSRGH